MKINRRRATYIYPPLPEITGIEENIANLWVSLGIIWATETGSENTYYTDEFGNKFCCKNYPR